MGSLIEKILAFIKGSEGDGPLKKSRAKTLNYLVMFGAAGVLLIILANAFNPTAPEPLTELHSDTSLKSGDGSGETDLMEISKAEEMLNRRLEEMLTRIEGVGQVKASINLDSTTETEYAINTTTSNRKTDEKDPRGGNRTITEVNENGQLVLLRESDSSKEAPVVVREIKPEVRGVVVVADGAADPQVKAALIRAVEVFLDIPVHKVVVLPRESR